VGLTTRQSRGAGGGHQAVHAVDLLERKPVKQLQHRTGINSIKLREKTMIQRSGERKRSLRENNRRGGEAAAAVISRR